MSRGRNGNGQVAVTLAAVVVALILIVANATPGYGAGAPSKGDPGGSVTGNRDDVLKIDGSRLTLSDEWRENASREVLAATLADAVGQNRIAINLVWTLVTGYLVMLMQAGFALLECGFCRAKNAAHVFMTNLVIYPISIIGFWVSGFALMFGGMGSPPATLGGIAPLAGPDFHGLFGTNGFCLSVNFYDVGVFSMFLFQMVFMDTMSTIPTGALAERWKFSAFIVYGFFVSMFLYPILGHWIWGGGWLAHLGSWGAERGFSLGHGVVDFAGAGVVHAVGGWTALAGVLVLGPRLGRFDGTASPNEFRAHNLPMALLGAFILAFGWFAFNSGSTLGASGGGALRIGIIAANTMLASASGSLAAMFYWWRFHGKPDPAMTANGMLAGLVAITGSCAFVNALYAIVIGAIAGVLVCIAIWAIESRKIDDPAGAIGVHGICGLWGLLSIGIFADGTYGANWNGVGDKMYLGRAGQGVTGCLHGDWGQLLAQVIGCAVCVIWPFGISTIFFRLQHRIQGIRSCPEDEIVGLDIPEIGVPAYGTGDAGQ